jgi:hypothetical protein
MQNASKSAAKSLESTPSKSKVGGGDISVGGALSESTGLLLLQAVRTLTEVQAQAVSTRFALFSQPLTFSSTTSICPPGPSRLRRLCRSQMRTITRIRNSLHIWCDHSVVHETAEGFVHQLSPLILVPGYDLRASRVVFACVSHSSCSHLPILVHS